MIFLLVSSYRVLLLSRWFAKRYDAESVFVGKDSHYEQTSAWVKSLQRLILFVNQNVTPKGVIEQFVKNWLLRELVAQLDVAQTQKKMLLRERRQRQAQRRKNDS